MSAQDTRRRFEQWIKNPQCTANAASAILNVPMLKVARAEGVTTPFGQSPYALVRGRKFEQAIFAKNAAVLREELEKNGILPKKSVGFADFRLSNAGGPYKKIEDALAATSAWLLSLKNKTATETIASGATIRIPGGVMLPEATLCIDALAIDFSSARIRLIVGEIKVYPDRGGFTDATQIATSRAQAGMYVHGLRLTVTALNLEDSIEVSDRGFLVLSRSGSNHIKLRPNEDLRAQAQRAQAGLAQLSTEAQTLQLDSSMGLPVIQKAATHYCESCLSFCERAEICHGRAKASHSAAVLGDDVFRALGGISLERVKELMNGTEQPIDQHEIEILELIRTGQDPDTRQDSANE